MQNKFDFIVIGAGSGGIAAANRAAEYGAKVVLIEKKNLGGTCVNLGCVPKKIMWTASQRMNLIKEASGFGIQVSTPDLDWKKLINNREAYIDRLHTSYNSRLQKNNITLINGEAKFHSKDSVIVDGTIYQAPHILISTGSHSKWPDLPGKDYGIDSDGFFALETLPKRVAVVGAGYIGVELAGLLKGLGSDVSLIYRKDSILRGFDSALSEKLLTIYQEEGIHLFPRHIATQLTKTPEGLVLHCENDKKIPPVDVLIWAIGRAPNSQSCQLDKIGIETDKNGYIRVDEYQNTNQDGIYAIGDVASQYQLTPVAIKAGRKLSDRLFNNQMQAKIDYHLIPTVIFSHPPIASVGMNEEEARKDYGDDIKVYQSQFTPMVNTFNTKPSNCFMKLITVKSTDKVIGCHMIGDMVDEILQGFAVAIKMGATKADFDATIAIHPTIAEELVTLR